MTPFGKPFAGVLSIMALIAAEPAASHHSFSMFDRTKPTKIRGVVREFQWVNPHTWIQFVVTEDGRPVEWSIEGRSPNVLARRGWTRNTLKPGDDLTLTIYPLKSGAPGGAIVMVEFADGRKLNADTPSAVDTDEEGPR